MLAPLERANLADPQATLPRQAKRDEIDVGTIAQFRAHLVTYKNARTKTKLSRKRINNILAVLSKSLKYAAEVGLISSVPRIGLYKVERPEVEFWDFEEYARQLRQAVVVEMDSPRRIERARRSPGRR